MIVVTGSSGKAGRAVVKDLLDHGYQTLGVDKSEHPDKFGSYVQADLTDLGQCFEVLKGASAVAHMANIPAPGLQPPATTFIDNAQLNYNVFQVAGACRAALGAELTDTSNYIIAANDTVMNRPSKTLMAEVFPGVPINAVDEYGTLLADRLAKTALSFTPQYSWRDTLGS